MSQSVICPRGHRVPLLEPPSDADVVCPECGSRCDIPPADEPPRPRGLWGLMRSAPASPAGEAPLDKPAPSAEAPKSLWALMGKPVATAPPAAPPAAPPEFRPVEISELQPAGRFSKPSAGTAAEQDSHETNEDHAQDGLENRPTDSAFDDDLEVAPLESIAEDEPPAPSPAPLTRAEPGFTPQRSRGAVRSVILGGAGVLASGLALRPELYARIPATLIGFLALMVGLLALGEIGRSRGRQRGRNWAGAGIALGILGMLLGPFVFSPLGGELRLRYGRRQTAKNLEQVGEALNAYYRDHGRYPPGSTHEQKKGSEDVALHNWMTMLLPHLGENEAALFRKIDLTRPWNHASNRRAMERTITAFHASGASRQKTQAGFAVTHFVALGGTLDVENVGRVNVGVFSRNSRVKRSDVTDGLEHTLIAGEIAFDFPAWGEPGQYRRIGKGLNVARDGFGNADRTGAMFLRADGSVKFLSNKTDPEILRKLSTRDGREKVDRLSY